MIDWDVYKFQIGRSSCNNFTWEADLQNAILDEFEDSPSFTTVVIKDEAYGVIITDENTLHKTPNQKRIIMKPHDIINVGDLVLWNDSYWLCLNADTDHPAYIYGLIKKCNITLKWISEDDCLIKKPAITTSQTLYTTGMKEEKIIQIPDGMTGILFSYDDNTKELDRGMSFIFNKTKYSTTHYNEADKPGIISLICSETGVNHSTDDLENGIANRWDKITGRDRLGSDERPPEPPYEDDDEAVYTIMGNDKLRESQIGTYTIVKTLSDQVIEGSYEFEISSPELAQIIDRIDNHCTIKANNIGVFDLIINDIYTSTETIKTIEIIPFL